MLHVAAEVLVHLAILVMTCAAAWVGWERLGAAAGITIGLTVFVLFVIALVVRSRRSAR